MSAEDGGEEEESCGLNPFCHGRDLLEDGGEEAANGVLNTIANAISDAVGEVFSAMTTVWVHLDTPPIDGEGGEEYAPTDEMNSVWQVADWITYIGLGLAVLSLIYCATRMALARQQGEAWHHIGGIGWVVAGVGVLASAGSLVGAVTASHATRGSATVLFLQNSTMWLSVGLVAIGVMIGAIRMAWERSGKAGAQSVGAIIRFAVVAGCGAAAVALLTKGADALAIYLIEQSTDQNLGEMLSGLMLITAGGGGLSVMIWIIVGIVIIIASLLQALFIFVRGALIVMLTGALPILASFTETKQGREWFEKGIGWLVAFIAYKPAAAFVYAAGFKLFGDDGWLGDTDTEIINVLSGLVLIVLALVALPALMRLIAPMTAGLGHGGGIGAAFGMTAGLMAGNLSALPSGAASAVGGKDSGEQQAATGDDRKQSQPQGAQQAGEGKQGESGTQGESGAGKAGPSGSSAGSGSTSATAGAGAGGGSSAAGCASASQAATVGTAAATGGASAAAGGAAGGGAAGGGAAGGAAAGGAASGAAGGIGALWGMAQQGMEGAAEVSDAMNEGMNEEE